MKKEKKKLDVENAFGEGWGCLACGLVSPPNPLFLIICIIAEVIPAEE